MLCSITDPPFESLPPSDALFFLPRLSFFSADFFFCTRVQLSWALADCLQSAEATLATTPGQPAIYPVMHIKPHDLYLYLASLVYRYMGSTHTQCVWVSQKVEPIWHRNPQSAVPNSMPYHPIPDGCSLPFFSPLRYEYEFNFSLGSLGFDFISFQFQLQALFPRYPTNKYAFFWPNDRHFLFGSLVCSTHYACAIVCRLPICFWIILHFARLVYMWLGLFWVVSPELGRDFNGNQKI